MAYTNARWQFSLKYLCLISLSLILLLTTFREGLLQLLERWETQEEYSHGYMIPMIVIYFVWQKKFTLQRLQFTPSWQACILVFSGLCLFLIGEVSALFILVQFAFVVVLIGLVWNIMGWQALRVIIVPLLLLLFAIPLPYFLEASLSADLQLLSSKLGVAMIRWYRIPVFLEGNLIDLGIFKLQVVDACSGLRYLYPLMSLGFICAYMYNAAFWKRAFLFFSTIPITIAMNSFRIGMIGVLVNKFGIASAEGFLHDFEGWVVFMACIGVLLLEMLILSKLSSDKRPLSEIFGLVIDEPAEDENWIVKHRPLSIPFFASSVMLAMALSVVISVNQREEHLLDRQSFPAFPMQVNNWSGQHESMASTIVKFLGVTDYILADFQNAAEKPVNFYVAYYASQRKGFSPHSPRVCIPGGGWKIASIERTRWKQLPINRIIIKKKNVKQIVYYWFQQRGRQMSNEYLMKWYLFRDAVLLNRTDGALVRFSSVVYPGETEQEAESRIQDLAENILPLLPDYIPE